MRDADLPKPAVTQPEENPTAEDEWDSSEERPQVTSLQPTPGGFSQRRLLNVVSVVVAAVALLALAIHWLPNALPKWPNAAATRVAQTFNAHLAPIRGSGWKTIGPDWAQDIAFTANGALGYACGRNPLNGSFFVAVYDTHQDTWMELPTPATGGNSCQVFVSPYAGNDVVIAVDSCVIVGSCSISYPASRLYESYDGGEEWTEIRLPSVVDIYSVAWTNATRLNSAQFLAVRGNLAVESTIIPVNTPSHLLVRQRDGSFVEVDAQRLVGHAMQFGNISLMSSGTTLYAMLDGLSCDTYCAIQVRSSDDGAYWSQFSANYEGSPIIPMATQPYSHILIGSAFLPKQGVLVPLKSVNDGDSWQNLPSFPTNPSTGGAVMFAAPDDSVYAFCYGDANVVYALRHGATHWQAIAPLPNGTPVTVQYDAAGHAIALWGRANIPTSALGLEYFPLQGSH